MKHIISITPLSSPWQTIDPFLFTMHHNDHFPKGTEDMGPGSIELRGRRIGNDFSNQNGWSMYHGQVVPGFPAHPHRGFETVTFVTKGLIDHSDSAGCQGRYGNGDTQWLTAGKGIQHAEMFPLLNVDTDNPLELFQIWLNLPARDKFVDPHYKMLWSEEIPVLTVKDNNQKSTTLTIIAGAYQDIKGLPPTPSSWANSHENHVSIWLIQMEPSALFTLPKVSSTLGRSLYYFEGNSVSIQDEPIEVGSRILLDGNADIILQNGSKKSSFLLLEGEPIGEPVASYGPFVMNTQQEIQDAYNDFHQTAFGGWPWKTSDPVLLREQGRFANYSNGKVENR